MDSISRPGRLATKTAVVVGAKLEDGDVGIGGAVARAFVREGARVLVVNRTAETGGALAGALQALAGDESAALFCQADVTREADVAAIAQLAGEAFGTVDVLVNNAAATGSRSADGMLLDVTASSWDAVYAINVRAPFLVCQYVIPLMLRAGGGSIINTTSIGSLAGDVIRTAYASSKAALNALTLYIATQYGRAGIRCNAVAPGLTVTGNTQKNMAHAVWDVYERHVLRDRPNTAEDVAAMYVFLASDEGAGVTGEIIRVDGGSGAHQPWTVDLARVLQG
jgi:NAD(P)-dependent dehydrogenase (short-subunit alcohol dehydrogenase family)